MNEGIGTKRRRKDVVSLGPLGAIIRENYMFVLDYVYHAFLHGTRGNSSKSFYSPFGRVLYLKKGGE